MIKGKLIKEFHCSLSNDVSEIFSDVEMNFGGSCKGLNPHEILEAALSACTMMTIQGYAKRKGITLKKLNVDVSVDREGVESFLTRDIKFDEDLDVETRESLLKVANKCPIHNLLVSDITINTKTK